MSIGYVCPLFKRIKILRALGIIGTKGALINVVTDTDGQFCCFQSPGTYVKYAGTNSIILRTVLTSENHFPSLCSMSYLFLYLFISFILSVWPLRAGISLRAGLGLIWSRKWISSACVHKASHLIWWDLLGKVGQTNSVLLQTCISQIERHLVLSIVLGALYALSRGSYSQVVESVGCRSRYWGFSLGPLLTS